MCGGTLTYLQKSKVWNIVEVYKLKIPWIINVKSIIGRCNGWSSLTKYSHIGTATSLQRGQIVNLLCEMCGRYWSVEGR